MTVSGVTEAKMEVDVTVYTWVTPSNGTPSIYWRAPKLLQITCLRDSPIN